MSACGVSWSTWGSCTALRGTNGAAAGLWDGLRDLAALYEEAAAVHDPEDEPYRFVYGGLYEAQCLLQVVPALELVAYGPGQEPGDVERIQRSVLAPAGAALVRWMGVMLVHNMSAWSMAALHECGRVLGRSGWIETAFHSERCGLARLLQAGVTCDAAETVRLIPFQGETLTYGASAGP